MCSIKKRKLPDGCAVFDECKIYVLPSALGQKRHALLEKQIAKYGGQVVPELSNKEVSHVVVDESMLADPATCLAVIKRAGHDVDTEPDVKVVGTLWLTKCFKEEQLVDTKAFELTFSKAAATETIQCEELNVGSAHSSEHDEQPSCPLKKPHLGSEKFVCSQASGHSSPGKPLNQVITNELQKLADAFRSSGDRWRSYGYDKAISAIKAYPKEITSYKEVETLPGIGQKMAAKVCEILESGKLRKVDEICGQERMKAVELFTKVWGVGPVTADAWYLQGCRSLEDLSTKVTLTKQQAIGLKHYDDFQARIPQNEVKKIGDMVANAARELDSSVTCLVGGSYRRGKATCGDIDVLVARDVDSSKFLAQLISRLKDEGLITDDLVTLEESGKQKKYFGVCRLPGAELYRRLDIFVVPQCEFAPALMHYTGSALFNRSIRQLAASKNMSLSEHSLVAGIIKRGKEILNSGYMVPTPSEESIFEALGLDYQPPEERDH